jgi:aminopeptidase N
MQKMIDERVEKHACMQRAREWEEKLSETGSRTSLWYPTENMYDYDVLFYKIDIEVVLDSEWVGGYVEMTAKSLVEGLNYVDLTLMTDLEVTAVRRNGYSLGFSHSVELLTVNLGSYFNPGDEFTIKIEYNGHPPYPYGMFFKEYDGHPVCYTSCEPFGARSWWPCKDFTFDKADSAEIIVKHPAFFGPKDIDCISNGILLSKVGGGTYFTSHWFEKYPITTYLVSLSISDYRTVVQHWEYAPGENMRVEHNYFPGKPPDDMSGSTYYMVNYTLPSLDALSYYFGLYPFWDEKYGHSHWTGGGAMEHQTSTTIGPNFNTEWVIVHELGHQWAGDIVTCETFNHIWLNEGFASYTEVLHYEYHYGWSYAHSWLMTQERINVGTPYIENIETDPIFHTATVYDKGSWLAHMLRRQMGDALFFPAMQDFYQTSEFYGGSATSEDLCEHLSQYYGSDMSWFFDAWVYQNGQPNYKYSYTYQPDGAGRGQLVTFFLEQQNVDGVFPMNVEIMAHMGGSDTTLTVWNDDEIDVYQFVLPYAPTYFEIDPDDNILKTVEQVSFAMRIAVGDLPDAFLDWPYSFIFTAIGGVPGYVWEHVGGQLPDGLTFNETTGELSGTPASHGDYSFTIRCTDSDSPANVEEREFSISVRELIFTRGDCDDSGGIDIDDVVFLINYIFAGGPAPNPIDAGDADCSGEVDIDDATYLIAYIFSGGPPPPEEC